MVLRATLVGETETVVLSDLDEDQILELRRMISDALRKHRHIVSCPECHGMIHVRRLPRTERYPDGRHIFAHNPGHGHCSIAARESDQHAFLKLHICAAAQAVPGFTATVEQPGDGIDPDTGRPPILDVYACRTDGREPWGFEVQLSPINEGQLLNRHELRAAQLDRCSWITTNRPTWARQVPWHQTSKGTDDKRCLVVGGVYDRRPVGYSQGVEDVESDPFPERTLVAAQLNHRIDFIYPDGWFWPKQGQTLTARARKPRPAVQQFAEWCSRTENIPDEAKAFDDTEWQWQAHIAHAALHLHDRLTPIHEAALARYPNVAMLDTIDELTARGRN